MSRNSGAHAGLRGLQPGTLHVVLTSTTEGALRLPPGAADRGTPTGYVSASEAEEALVFGEVPPDAVVRAVAAQVDAAGALLLEAGAKRKPVVLICMQNSTFDPYFAAVH
jgi:hypothetical protein